MLEEAELIAQASWLEPGPAWAGSQPPTITHASRIPPEARFPAEAAMNHDLVAAIGQITMSLKSRACFFVCFHCSALLEPRFSHALQPVSILGQILRHYFDGEN